MLRWREGRRITPLDDDHQKLDGVVGVRFWKLASSHKHVGLLVVSLTQFANLSAAGWCSKLLGCARAKSARELMKPDHKYWAD